jgi:hypothetical protein
VSKINIGKAAAGGVLAGVILSGLDFVINNYILAGDWQNVAHLRNIDLAVMGGPSALVVMFVVDFILGQVLVVTYAAIRPRFGPGAGTAATAAFLIFLPVGLQLATFAGLFISWELYVRQAALLLVAMIVAAIAGAWVYAEDDEET